MWWNIEIAWDQLSTGTLWSVHFLQNRLWWCLVQWIFYLFLQVSYLSVIIRWLIYNTPMQSAPKSLNSVIQTDYLQRKNDLTWVGISRYRLKTFSWKDLWTWSQVVHNLYVCMLLPWKCFKNWFSKGMLDIPFILSLWGQYDHWRLIIKP